MDGKYGIFLSVYCVNFLSAAAMRVKFFQFLCFFPGLAWSYYAHPSITVEVCYDFGCKSRQEVSLQTGEWASVRALFNASNADMEREQIKLAVARMETLVGQYTPTYLDIGGNLPLPNGDDQFKKPPGQLDCIDESINTKGYLELFEKSGLLKFHTVTKRVYRRSFLTQHWAVQLQEINTDRLFVVDSWFENNGEPPVVVSSETWHDLSL